MNSTKPAKLLLTAAFGAATLALTGCGTLDMGGRGYLPPRAVPVQPALPVQVLPAGVTSVPYYGAEAPGTIMVDIQRHRLFFTQANGTALSYPIGSPRNGADIPPAYNVVTRKAVNPTWTPTENMRARNPSLPVQVPGGVPENPMGVRALYLGDTLYRIHGTNEPQSIGTNASSGCIRMLNEHVIDLYNRVPTGTRVLVYLQDFVPGIAYGAVAAPRPAY